MYAVTIEPLNAIIFLGDRPEEDEWAIQDDVELDLAPNYALWPAGKDAPEQVLCVSTSDPKLYTVYRYAREVDRVKYLPTGRNFGGVFSRAAWGRFRKGLAASIANGTIPVDDPPGPPVAAAHEAEGVR